MPEVFLRFLLLFATGLTAGLVDSIAGGGGMITLPVLLAVGLSPQQALGTNKFQSSFGSFTASYYHIRKGIVRVNEALVGIVCTLIGAALGAWTVQQIDNTALSAIIPFFLLGIALYTLFTPKVGEAETQPRFGSTMFYVLFGALFGFYDGFFGPGVGSFWAFAFVLLLGFNLTRATGYTKLMNFTSNIVSFVLFSAGGSVLYAEGMVMAAGQMVGARIGSGLAIRKGARFIRPIYVGIVIMTTLKLLYDRYG